MVGRLACSKSNRQGAPGLHTKHIASPLPPPLVSSSPPSAAHGQAARESGTCVAFGSYQCVAMALVSSLNVVLWAAEIQSSDTCETGALNQSCTASSRLDR